MNLHWYEIAFGVFCLGGLLTWLLWPVRKNDDDLEDKDGE